MLIDTLYIYIYIYIYMFHMFLPWGCKDGVVWLWHLSVWLTIPSCYSSIPLTFGLIGNDGSLSSLCHSCRLACQQRILKTFPGPGYLLSKDGVVWLWHLLVNLYIYLYTYTYFFQINHKSRFTPVKDDREQTIQVSSFA